jgi:hypothetical protein
MDVYSMELGILLSFVKTSEFRAYLQGQSLLTPIGTGAGWTTEPVWQFGLKQNAVHCWHQTDSTILWPAV